MLHFLILYKKDNFPNKYFSFLKCLGHPKTAAVYVQDGQQRDKEKGEDAVN